MPKKIHITKASGEKAIFDRDKLQRSLERSGAGKKIINQVIKEVEGELHEGVSTHEIYKKAFRLLKKTSGHYAARYRLKNSIMELGPSGFPFERYVSEILKYQGYEVEVDQIVHGKCVHHEIDIIARKGDKQYMIECKYHNSRGIKSDVKVPLYIHSRFKDVEYEWLQEEGKNVRFHQGWVATNTKFTEDAIQYGACAGLYMLGWDYPKGNGIKDMIEVSGLYPITCLTTLSQQEKQRLLDNNVVLCHSLHDTPAFLEKAGVSTSRIKKILDEIFKLHKIIDD